MKFTTKVFRILFTVGNVDRHSGRHSGRYSGRQSVDSTMQMDYVEVFFFANKLCFLQVQLQFPREILQFHPQILKSRGV